MHRLTNFHPKDYINHDELIEKVNKKFGLELFVGPAMTPQTNKPIPGMRGIYSPTPLEFCTKVYHPVMKNLAPWWLSLIHI